MSVSVQYCIRHQARYLGDTAGDGFGIGVANAGDTSGDGSDDLLVGGWFNDHAGTNGGSAWLYR